jgi:hypothetical protein
MLYHGYSYAIQDGKNFRRFCSDTEVITQIVERIPSLRSEAVIYLIVWPSNHRNV